MRAGVGVSMGKFSAVPKFFSAFEFFGVGWQPTCKKSDRTAPWGRAEDARTAETDAAG
jgi:hypothetical protein